MHMTHLMSNLRSISPSIYNSITVVFLILSINFYGIAQDAIITVNNPSGVNVCDVSETVQIDILNTSGMVLSGVTIDVILPSGISYETSGLIDIDGYNVTEKNISNLASIVLSVNNIPTDSLVTFSIDILADMGAISFQNSRGVFRN